jgi:hypothetical protein
MTVSEYHDRFTQLSRYAPSEVANDADKQHHFLKGLNDDLRLQLKITTYPDYQMLVNRAIVIDNERREIEAKKRRFQGQVSGSNTHLRPNPQSGFPQRSQGPPNQWNKGQNQQRSQYPQQSGGQRPHYPQQQNVGQRPHQLKGHQVPCQYPPNNAPMKNGGSNDVKKCFRYGKEGHMSYNCPEFPNQPNAFRNGNQKMAPNGSRVNHVNAETTQEAPEVMLGTFSVNSIPATILFDSGASHSFIS